MALIGTLTDDFNDNSLDPAKWTGSYGTVAETNNQAEISCTAGYSGFISNGLYDLTGSYMFAEITRPSIGIGTTQAYFQLNQDSNNGLIMVLESTNLTMRVRTAGSNSDTSITYDATAHKWWRIRESGGSAYFDTSPNGVDWTNQRTVSTPAFATSVAVDLSSGYYGAETSPTPFILDNFNIPPTVTAWITA